MSATVLYTDGLGAGHRGVDAVMEFRGLLIGVLGLALAFAVVATGSKLVAGLAVYHPGTRRGPVGVGMVPRGEVGLIFAGLGLAATVVAQDLCSALVVMVMITTFVAPAWLKVL